jgi:hypothetical protein
MTHRSLRKGLFLFVACLSLLLSLDLLVFNAVVLPLMRMILAAAYQGEALPIVNQLFRAVATDSARISLSAYQDKLFYAYQALKVPLLALAVGAALLAWSVAGPQAVTAPELVAPRRLAFMMLWVLTTTLLVHVQVGSYVRFMADDYCIGAETVTRGIIGAAIYWYTVHLSRYSTDLVLSIQGALGPRLVPLYPGLILVAWCAATAFAVSQLTVARTRLGRLCLSVLLSATVVCTTLRTSIDLPQSLYWASSMGNMLPPLVLLAVCVGLLLRRTADGSSANVGWRWFIGAGFLAFAAGGFTEAFTVVQVGVWALILLAALLIRDSRARSSLLGLVAPFLLGSLAALAAHVAAPGFHARLATYDAERTIVGTIEIASASTVEWLRWAFSSWERSLSLLALLLLSFLASGRYFAGHLRLEGPLGLGWRALVLVPTATLGLVYSSFLPGAYAFGGSPPGRHLIVPAFILSCAVALEGAIIGRLITADPRRNVRSIFGALGIATLALLLATSAMAMVGQLRLLPSFARYASAWDSNEELILSALNEGADRVTIAAMPVQWWNVDFRDIGPDPGFWVNQCASRYYGMEVTAQGPPVE